MNAYNFHYIRNCKKTFPMDQNLNIKKGKICNNIIIELQYLFLFHFKIGNKLN